MEVFNKLDKVKPLESYQPMGNYYNLQCVNLL